MRILTTLLVILGGVGLALQAAMNTRLRAEAQSPVMSALLSFVIGAVALAAMAALGVLGRGRIPAFGSVPPWAWCGGLMGAFYVTYVVVAVPRIGTALVMASTVLGQLGAALALDTLGWLGVPRLPLSPTRIAGAALLLCGVLLMQWKR